MAMITSPLVFTRGQADGTDAVPALWPVATVLTLVYQKSPNHFGGDEANEIELSIEFLKGSSDGLSFLVQTSDDEARWYAATIVDLTTKKIIRGEFEIDSDTIDAATEQDGWTFRVAHRRKLIRVWAKARGGSAAGSSLQIQVRPTVTT